MFKPRINSTCDSRKTRIDSMLRCQGTAKPPVWLPAAIDDTDPAGPAPADQRRGREHDPVPSLAGAHRVPADQVGSAAAGWPQRQHVRFRGDGVQGFEVRDQRVFQTAGVVEVEVPQALAGGKACGAIRRSPSSDSCAETSRCSQATRDSSWLEVLGLELPDGRPHHAISVP